MELHPARVERDRQKLVVAKLKCELDQFPRGMVQVFDRLEVLQSSLNECAETKSTWELQKAIGPDSEAGQQAILQAEDDHMIADRTRKQVTEDIESWVKRYGFTKPQLEAYAVAKTEFEQSEDKLRELQFVLDDIENLLEDRERERREQASETAKLGSVTPAQTPQPASLAHRFTNPKKRRSPLEPPAPPR